MLELINITAGYHGRHLLEDANATLAKGELATLVGANGAGKSTLLRIMSGDLAPLDGEVTVAGRPLGGMSRRELARLVSVVNTDRVEADALTVREVVEMGRYPHTGFFGRFGADDRRIVDEALAVTGTERFSTRNVSTLSDGERQKVMVARALAQDTPVVLLDEPTAFLDVAGRVELLNLLRRLAAECDKAVLLSSHHISSALELSDRLWLMPGDRTLVVDTPANLIAAQKAAEPGNPLDRLFAGRNVTFDPLRLDYR